MSRLSRYKDSLSKFIKSKSCMSKDTPNAKLYQIIYSYTKDSDLILPVILLTFMNGQNRMHDVSSQGYNAATSIELVIIILRMMRRLRTTIIIRFRS